LVVPKKSSSKEDGKDTMAQVKKMMELQIAKKYGNKIIRKAEQDARQSSSVKRKAKKIKVVKNKFHRHLS